MNKLFSSITCRIVSLAFCLVLLMSLGSTFSAATANFEAGSDILGCEVCLNTHNNKSLRFDWNDYVDILSTTYYQLRVSIKEEHNIKEVVLGCLIIDELIPRYALFLADLENEIFIRFVDDNVIVEYVEDSSRGPCCYPENEQHVPLFAWGKYNSGGWCVRHCRISQLRCGVCHYVYVANAHTIILSLGCGYHVSNPAYQLCSLGMYAPFGQCPKCN